MEPVRIGVAISNPSWVSDSASSSLMRMPMMEKMVQTAKHRVKAKVESKKVEAVEPKKFDDTEKLAMVMEHLRSQMDMTAALISALSK